MKVDRERCIHCGACVKDCPAAILALEGEGMPRMVEGGERFCIHCQHCLAVCPVAAFSIDGLDPDLAPAAGVLPEPDLMLNLLRGRRSVRHYQPENLDRETLDKLKNSLHWSPTGCNDHRLFFAVVEERSVMDSLCESASKMLRFLVRSGLMYLIYPGFARRKAAILAGEDFIFRGAPHLIVAATPKNAPCADMDPVIALTQFDLYLQSLKLGSCWCGFAVHAFRWNRSMREKLHLPKGYRVVAAMLFGKVAVHYPRAPMPEPFVIHTVDNEN